MNREVNDATAAGFDPGRQRRGARGRTTAARLLDDFTASDRAELARIAADPDVMPLLRRRAEAILAR